MFDSILKDYNNKKKSLDVYKDKCKLNLKISTELLTYDLVLGLNGVIFYLSRKCQFCIQINKLLIKKLKIYNRNYRN